MDMWSWILNLKNKCYDFFINLEIIGEEDKNKKEIISF